MEGWGRTLKESNKWALLLPLGAAVLLAVLFQYGKEQPEGVRSALPNTAIPLEESELQPGKVGYYEQERKDSLLSSQPETELYSRSLEAETGTVQDALMHQELKKYYQDTRLPPQNPYTPPQSQMVEQTIVEEDSDPISFYSKPKEEKPSGEASKLATMVEAQIVGQQEITEKNNWVKLRLLEPLPLGAITLPKNSLVFGTADFDPQRIYIEVNSIRADNRIVPVALEAYDHYGIRGLAVHGGTGAEVEEELTEAVTDEVLNEETLRKIPGIRAGKKLFRKTPKAKLNNDPLVLVPKSL